MYLRDAPTVRLCLLGGKARLSRREVKQRGVAAAFGCVYGAKKPTVSATDFSLGLIVTRAEDNLAVKWNREAPAVRAAQKGLLEIEDGGYAKPVDLDPAHLQGGSIIYRNTTSDVRFRLSVYLNGRLTVTENIEWRQ